MFNTGFRGKRASDGTGIINPQENFVQSKYPVPTITSWTISGSDDDALNPAGGQTVLVNGGGFFAGCAASVNGVTITPVTVISANQISFTSPALAGGSYTLIVYNSAGGGAILVPGLVYSSVPTYTTAQGSIGSGYETSALSTSVVATSDSSITYTITSGALPSGASMTSGGVITGTYPTLSVGTSETFYFDITATDAEDQDVTRSFTLTTNIDVVTWSTPSLGTTVNSDGTAYSQALSATSAAGKTISYSADALPDGLTLSGGTISGTPTNEGTSSTVLTATAATTNRSATNTITWVVSLNDRYFGNIPMLLTASTSLQTQSFISDNSTNNAQLVVAGDTRAQSFNPYQPGYYSLQFSATPDYFLLPVSGQLAFPGDYTIECWVYLNSVTGTQGVYSSIDNSGDSWQGPFIGFSGTTFNATSYIGSTDTISHQTAVSAGQWYHIAMVRSGSITKSYLNGVQSTSTTTSTYSLTQSGSSIGTSYPGSSPLNGNISNLRIVKGYALYTTSFTPPTAPLENIVGTVLLVGRDNKFIDNSTGTLTMTATGAPKISTANPFSNTYQLSSNQYYSMNVDGTGDYITTSASTNFDMGTGDFTIECFATTNGYAGSQYGRGLFALYPSGNYNKRMIVRHSNVGNILAIYGYDGSSTYFGSSGTGGTFNLTNGLWYHIAFVRQSGVFRLYINGVQDIVVSNQTAVTLATSNCFDIGRVQEGSTPEWNGNISNFRVIKGTCLYPGGTTFVPPMTALTAISGTSLLTCQDSTFKDNSSTGATFTVGGTAKPISVSPFTPQHYSTYFSATSTNYWTVPANAAFNLGTSDFSIEFWVRPMVQSTYSGLLSFDSGGDYPLCFYWASAAGSGNIVVAAGTTTAWFANTSAMTFGTTTTGQWTHVLLTRSGSAWRCFQDGVLRFYTSQAGTVGDSSNGIYIGNNGSGATYMASSYISNLRIIKGSIPTSYQTSSTTTGTTIFTPSTSALTTTSQGATAAHVSLLTCQSMYAIDNSTNAFAITQGTSPTITGVSPFAQTLNYTSTQVTSLGSAYFSGTNGAYTTVPASPSMTLGTNNHTIECWVYAAGSQQTYTVPWAYAAGSTNQATNSYYLAINTGSGNLLLGSGGGWGVNIGFTCPMNSWVHIAVVRSGNVFTLYINGVALTPATYAATIASQGSFPLIIGGQVTGTGVLGNTALTGYVSDFRFVNGTALYTSNFVPKFTGPLTNVTNTQLLTFQTNGSHNNTTFNDTSSFNTLISRPASTNTMTGTFSPYGDNYSVYLNGSSYFTIPTATAASLYGGIASSLITIEFWLYTTNIQAVTAYRSGIFGNFVGNAVNGRYMVMTVGSSTTSAQQIAFGYTTGTGSSAEVVSTGTFNQNIWHHVAITIDSSTASSSTIKMYINGTGQTFTGINLSTHSTDPGANYQLGADGGGNYQSHYGYISNFRFTRGQLVYTGNFTPPTTPLTMLQSAGTNIAAITTASYVKTLALQSNRFSDNSMYNVAFSLTSAPKVQKFSPFGSFTIPKYYSTYFNGSSTTDFLSVATNTALAMTSSDFSAEAWVYFSSLPASHNETIMNKSGKAGVSVPNWDIHSVNGYWGYFVGQSGSSGSAILNIQTTTVNVLQTWQHVCLIKTGTTYGFYVNGTRVHSTTSATVPADNNPLPLSIGYQTDQGSSSYLNGYISNARICKVTLPSGYDATSTTITVPTSPLTAITGTVFLACQDNVMKDNSVNNFAITSTGSVKSLNVSPFTPAPTAALNYSVTTFGGSMYFDGTGDALTSPATGALIMGSADFTVEFWEFNEDTSDRYLFAIGDGWSIGTGLCIIHYSGAYALSGGGTATTGIGSVKAGQWNHIALSRYGGNINVYVNGIYAGQEYVASNALTENILKIGTASAASWPNYKGYISDLRILKGTALYKGNFFPSSTPNTPLANTTLLLNGANSGILDASRTIDMETVADAKVTPFSPYNGAYYSNFFNGSTDYLSVGFNTALELGAPSADFTIECWINMTSLPASTCLLDLRATASTANGLLWIVLADGSISLQTGNGFLATGSPAGAITIGKWYHVALVRASSLVKVYVNGTQVNGSYTSTATYTQTTGSNYIGQYSGVGMMPGYISNFRIVKGTAITPPAGGPTAPLTAVSGTGLLTCQSNTFIDKSTNALTITMNGTPTIATQNPFQVNTGQSYYFDGTGDGVAFPGTYWPSGAGSAFTIEMWIYPIRTNAGIVRCDGNGTSLSLAVTSSKQISLGNVFVADFMTSTLTVTMNAWNHIAITRTTANLYSIYINGTSAGTPITYATSLGAQAKYYIAYNTYGDNYSYYGYITDFRVTLATVRTITVPIAPYKTN